MAEKQVQRVSIDGRTVRLTSLDRVVYPATETTKGEVLDYYVRIAPILLPHLAERPVTRVRWTSDVTREGFFEKNVPSGVPSWVERVTVGDNVFPLVPDVSTLAHLVNLNSLELHVPQWRVGADGSPQCPDRLVIDLDPGKPAGLHECAQVALLFRERLADIGMRLHPVTSGRKGMQLYAALAGDLESAQVSELVQQLAQDMTKLRPELVVWRMTPSLRTGRVFVDWSQNVARKTTISPYSLRGRDLPCVATPRTWEEVERGAARPDALEQVLFEDVLDRVDDLGDLLADLA